MTQQDREWELNIIMTIIPTGNDFELLNTIEIQWRFASTGLENCQPWQGLPD